MKKSKWIKRVQANWTLYLTEKANKDMALQLFQSESHKRKLAEAMVLEQSKTIEDGVKMMQEAHEKVKRLIDAKNIVEKECHNILEKLNQSQKENCELRRNLGNGVLVPRDVLDTIFEGSGNPVLDRQQNFDKQMNQSTTVEPKEVTRFTPSTKTGNKYTSRCKNCGEFKWNHDAGFLCRKKVVSVQNPKDNFFQNEDGSLKGTKPELNNDLPIRVKVIIKAWPSNWYNIGDEYDVAEGGEIGKPDFWLMWEDYTGTESLKYIRTIHKKDCEIVRHPLIRGMWPENPQAVTVKENEVKDESKFTVDKMYLGASESQKSLGLTLVEIKSRSTVPKWYSKFEGRRFWIKSINGRWQIHDMDVNEGKYHSLEIFPGDCVIVGGVMPEKSWIN